MPATGEITQPELVVHAVFSADDPSLAQLRRLWDAAIKVLGATETIDGYPDQLPVSSRDVPVTAEPFTVREHPHQLTQLVMRRARKDTVLLSVLIAREWAAADDLWDRVLEDAEARPLLRMWRLFLGKVPDDVTDLAGVGPWPSRGEVTEDGRCAMWSLEPVRSAGDRQLGVLARQRDELALTERVWWRGADELPLVVPDLIESPGGYRLRLGFMADVVGYGRRRSVARDAARRRCHTLFVKVFDALRAEKVQRVLGTDGDATIGLFPVDTDPVFALARLVTTTDALLAADNDQHSDPLALRMAISFGLVVVADHGFGGRLVIDLARLVDSEPLRTAAREPHPLAVIVSNKLYQEVIADGYPMVEDLRFTRASVEVKEYDEAGWLWTPSR